MSEPEPHDPDTLVFIGIIEVLLSFFVNKAPKTEENTELAQRAEHYLEKLRKGLEPPESPL